MVYYRDCGLSCDALDRGFEGLAVVGKDGAGVQQRGNIAELSMILGKQGIGWRDWRKRDAHVGTGQRTDGVLDAVFRQNEQGPFRAKLQ